MIPSPQPPAPPLWAGPAGLTPVPTPMSGTRSRSSGWDPAQSLFFKNKFPSSVDFNLVFIFTTAAVDRVLLWDVLVSPESLPLQSLSTLPAIIHHTDVLEAVEEYWVLGF